MDSGVATAYLGYPHDFPLAVLMIPPLPHPSPRTGRTRPLGLRMLVPALLLASAAACGDPAGPGGGVNGTWVSDDFGTPLYVQITSSTYSIAYERALGCYIASHYDIIERDGDVFTLQEQGSDVLTTSVIRRSGENLVVVGTAGIEVTLERSSVDLASLAFCGACATFEFPEDSPIDPNDVEFVSLGTTRTGSLTTSDLQEGTNYLDFWALAVDAEMPVRIELGSSQFDAFLTLFDDQQSLVAHDDDSGPGSDAAIASVLQAGCWLVGVTSADSGGTGDYLLTVE